MRPETIPEPAKTRARDPKAGTVLTASAGSSVEAEFSFFNDSPDVAGFCLDVAGLADDWVSGAGTDCEAMAAASGGDILMLKLSPPANSAVGDYELRVRILSGGIPVGRETPLTLRVQPGRDPASAPTPKAAYSKPAADAPPKRPRAAARLAVPPPAEASLPDPAESAATLEIAAPKPVLESASAPPVRVSPPPAKITSPDTVVSQVPPKAAAMSPARRSRCERLGTDGLELIGTLLCKARSPNAPSTLRLMQNVVSYRLMFFLCSHCW